MNGSYLALVLHNDREEPLTPLDPVFGHRLLGVPYRSGYQPGLRPREAKTGAGQGENAFRSGGCINARWLSGPQGKAFERPPGGQLSDRGEDDCHPSCGKDCAGQGVAQPDQRK